MDIVHLGCWIKCISNPGTWNAWPHPPIEQSTPTSSSIQIEQCYALNISCPLKMWSHMFFTNVCLPPFSQCRVWPEISQTALKMDDISQATFFIYFAWRNQQTFDCYSTEVCLVVSNWCWHSIGLTHWPLGDLDAILKTEFSILFYWLVSSDENDFRWMPRDLTDDKSTLVQVMAWCRQATSHYLKPEPMLTQIYVAIWRH